MILTFLGTRGYIAARTRLHQRHSSLLVAHAGAALRIDVGEDWRGRTSRAPARAILLTHAHPDHAGGLVAGAAAPVYATAETWAPLRGFPIRERAVVEPRAPFAVGPFVVEAFPVAHSLRAPAVGYRLAAGRAAIFYAPDLVHIPDRTAALARAALYVGDGATVERPLVRRRGDLLIGHAAVRTQLGWCAREGVTRAVFTHCGTEIVTADPRAIAARVRALGAAHGVEAEIARDGLRLRVGACRPIA